MGLLKHFLVPFFAVMHMYAISLVAFDKPGVPAAFGWPDSELEKLTPYEEHSFGIIGAYHAALLFACLAGIFNEHAHFRGLVLGMELIAWSIGSYDAMQLGFPCKFALVNAALAALGLIIHSQEPGIFTKDKDKVKAG